MKKLFVTLSEIATYVCRYIVDKKINITQAYYYAIQVKSFTVSALSTGN